MPAWPWIQDTIDLSGGDDDDNDDDDDDDDAELHVLG